MTDGRRLDRAAELSWNVPVPVRRSCFEPLHAEHAGLNVETHLAAIGAYGARARHPAPETLLWADHQDHPGHVMPRRLGAGRAGSYRGWYLKGVGRTPLAANWPDPADLDHQTGHLLPSGALREVLVSEFLRAQNSQAAIVPACGLLVRPRAPQLRGHIERRLRRAPAGEGDAPAIAADIALQCMTVKPAGFARYANVLWLLHRSDLGHGGVLAAQEMLECLLEACDTEADAASVMREPGHVGAQLASAVERGWRNFHAAWRAGVYWGSIGNNFTIDGRFVDLEWPVILGRPALALVMAGRHARCPVPTRSSRSGCFEVLEFVAHTRLALRTIDARLSGLVRLAPRREPARDVVAAALQGLRSALGTRHWLWSERLVAQRLLAWMHEVDVDAAERQRLHTVVSRVCRAHLGGRHGGMLDVPVRPLDRRLARLGLTFRPDIHLLAGAAPPVDDLAQFVNESLDRLEDIADPQRLLAELADVIRTMRRHGRPAAAADMRARRHGPAPDGHATAGVDPLAADVRPA
jgi:hypothetical protein